MGLKYSGYKKEKVMLVNDLNVGDIALIKTSPDSVELIIVAFCERDESDNTIMKQIVSLENPMRTWERISTLDFKVIHILRKGESLEVQ
jgi:hypothetical protein